MSRFVEPGKLEKVELGDGEWVKILGGIAFSELEGIRALLGGDEVSNSEAAKAMLGYFVKEWNLKDDDGNDVPVTEENIDKLDVPTVSALVDAVAPKIDMDPKAKKPSGARLEEKEGHPSTRTE